jgi:hypothetical protein
MTLFDERERAFELIFVHEEDLRFLARARRNRLFGSWAAEQLGLRGQEWEQCIASFLRCAVDQQSDETLIERVRSAFLAHGVPAFDRRIRAALTEAAAQAVIQIRAGIPPASTPAARPSLEPVASDF